MQPKYPFSHLIETNSYPYSKILRSNYLERTIDSFIAFAGESNNWVGIFDYLMFRIPYHLAGLAINCFLLFLRSSFSSTTTDEYGDVIGFHQNPIPLALRIPLGIILGTLTVLTIAFALSLFAIKLSLSAVMTVIAHPFVLLTHLVTKPTQARALNDIDTISLLKIELGKTIGYSAQDNNLPNFVTADEIKEPKKNFIARLFHKDNKLPIKRGEVRTEIAPQQMQQMSETGFRDYSNYLHGFQLKPIKYKDKIAIHTKRYTSCQDHEDGIIEIKPENYRGISALIRMNLFGITTKLENVNILDIVEKTVGLKI